MPYTKIIEQRLHFLGLDKHALSTMKKIKSILEPSIDHMLDRFYDQVTKEPEITALFPTKDSVAAARGAQRNHWMKNLFTDDIGKAHFKNAEKIGQTHERIGLSLSYYLGGYCIMLNQFLTAINDHSPAGKIDIEMLHTLNKAVFLDMDSVIDSYLEAKDQAMKKILIQTEKFSSGLKKINSTLGKQATDHQNHISTLCDKGDAVNHNIIELEKKIAGIKKLKPKASSDSNQHLMDVLHESASLLKTNREMHVELGKVKLQAIQLADQINDLNSTYDKLQDECKCHFLAPQEQSIQQKIKSFFQ